MKTKSEQLLELIEGSDDPFGQLKLLLAIAQMQAFVPEEVAQVCDFIDRIYRYKDGLGTTLTYQEAMAPKEEIRVYGVEPYDEEKEDSFGLSILEATDEHFIQRAEEQGLVWTLNTFIEYLNETESIQQFFRIIKTKTP